MRNIGCIQVGSHLTGGDVIGQVQESELILHKVNNDVLFLKKVCIYTIISVFGLQ